MQEKRATPTTVSLKWCHGLNLKHSPHPHILCADDTFQANCGAFKRRVAGMIGPEAWSGAGGGRYEYDSMVPDPGLL